MAESITAVECLPGEWTLIAENVSTVCFQWRSEIAFGRWTFGSSEPAPDIQNYWTLRVRTPQSLNELTAGTKVWAMPNGGAPLIMEVAKP